MADLKEGQELCGWQLLRPLGEGGNAEVWRATRDPEEGPVAVKFLKTRKTESLRWERFRREVDYLSSLGKRPGVLPILDHDLPEAPRAGERAWYSMPEAAALAAALADADLSEVVAALVPIAATLAELGERDGAAHRDLKPANLYLWEGEPVVGDFGLLWRPDLVRITHSEIPGAFSFTAPELFREDLDEDRIDYERADVFSLAKTLWALARGQTFAIPGTHDPNDPETAIGLYRPGQPSAAALDLVVSTATQGAPARRPTMAGFAGELERWLEIAGPAPELPELAAVSAQIREQLEPAVARERESEELIGYGRAAVAAARSGLAPLFARLAAEIPGARTDVSSPEIETMMKTWEAMGTPEVLYRESVCAEISDRSEPLALVLAFGAMVEVLETGVVRIGAARQLGIEKVLGQETDQSGVVEVRAGSVEQEAAVRSAVDWVGANVGNWLARFAEGAAAG